MLPAGQAGSGRCPCPVSALWRGALDLLSAEHGPGEGVRHSGARRSPPQRQVREPRGQLLQRPPRKGPSRAPHRCPWARSGLPARFRLLRPSPLTHSQPGRRAVGLSHGPWGPGGLPAHNPATAVSGRCSCGQPCPCHGHGSGHSARVPGSGREPLQRLAVWAALSADRRWGRGAAREGLRGQGRLVPPPHRGHSSLSPSDSPWPRAGTVGCSWGPGDWDGPTTPTPGGRWPCSEAFAHWQLREPGRSQRAPPEDGTPSGLEQPAGSRSGPDPSWGSRGGGAGPVSH